MIWSHSISPQTSVECLDSFESTDVSKLFAISLTERNKSKLKFISYGTPNDLQPSPEDNESSIIDEEKIGGDSNGLKLLKEKLSPLDNKIINLKFSNNGDSIFSLDSQGGISIWKFSLDDDINEPLVTFKNDSINSNQILFNTFIKPEYLKLDSKSSKVETLLLTVESSDSSNLLVKIYSIKSNEILEIFSSQIDFKLSNSLDLQFTFDIVGNLIIFNPANLLITSFNLPNVSIIKETPLNDIFKNEPSNSKTSIMSVSTNRVLISKGSTLALIDLKFNSLLSILDLYPRSKEIGSLKSPKTLTILNVPIVNGNSIKSKVSFALVILKSERENYAQIQYISIDTGLGKLSDSLGKAIPDLKSLNSNSTMFIPFTQFMSKDNGEIINSKMERKGDELSKAYKNFKTIKSKNDIPKLEKSIISFLKCIKSIDSIDDFKVYEYESDRIVDPKFFKLITKLLFNSNEDDSLTLNGEGGYIPEMGVTYLLTHPLFPIEYTPGILKVLQISPRLLRQAIVTCVNLPLCDLIEQLSLVEDDETFKDIISRMITEFSTDEITQETIKLLKRRRSDENNFDLDKIINRILKLNSGYEILNSFIDSNGLILSLHYSNDESQLDKLINQTKEKGEDLLQESQLAILVDLALAKANINKKSSSSSSKRKSKKKSVEEIIEDPSKSSMLLEVGNSGVAEKREKTTYTVDRLVI